MVAQAPRGRRVAQAVPLVIAALLAVVAVGTVEKAGCDHPGRYVTTVEGVQLVGGCAVPAVDDPWPHGTPVQGGPDTDARRG